MPAGALLWLVAAALVAMAPIAIYYLRHPSDLMARGSEVSFLNPIISQGSAIQALMRGLDMTLAGFGLTLTGWSAPSFVLLPDRFAIACFLVGLVIALMRLQEPHYLFLTVWWLVSLIPSSLAVGSFFHLLRRTVLAEPAVFLVRGVALVGKARGRSPHAYEPQVDWRASLSNDCLAVRRDDAAMAGHLHPSQPSRWAIRHWCPASRPGQDRPVSEFSLGEVSVAARVREFSAPAVEHPVDITLGNRVRLLGYDISLSANHTARLTLYWQAVKQMDKAYKVFVHIIDSKNLIWTQSDSPPAGGQAPTTGWLTSEVLADHHDLSLPADTPSGVYTLIVGMYDPQTGHRLNVSGADADAIRLTQVEIP